MPSKGDSVCCYFRAKISVNKSFYGNGSVQNIFGLVSKNNSTLPPVFMGTRQVKETHLPLPTIGISIPCVQLLKRAPAIMILNGLISKLSFHFSHLVCQAPIANTLLNSIFPKFPRPQFFPFNFDEAHSFVRLITLFSSVFSTRLYHISFSERLSLCYSDRLSHLLIVNSVSS